MKSIKNALCLSGAAFKIPFLAGAVSEAIKRRNYTVFGGTSSGALIVSALATGTFPAARAKVLEFTPKDVFKQSPQSRWGQFRAALRVISGKTHLFDQSKLRDTLKNIVTQEAFANYVLYSSSPCFIGVVDEGTIEQYFYNIHQYSYNDAIDIIMASSSLPVLTDSVDVNGKAMVDGGIRSHISSPWIAKNVPNVTHITSVYSRPGVFDKINWRARNKSFGRGLVSRMLRVINILSWEVSKYDEYECDAICEQKSISQLKVFAPETLLDSLYDVENNHDKLFSMGKKSFTLAHSAYYESNRPS